MTRSPSRDDTGTITCPVCQTRFTPAGRQRYCSGACRKTAFRRRHQDPPGPLAVPAAKPRRDHTIYECPVCEQRLLGEQRCPDCGIFGRRIGAGGPCPHCAEPVAITDLLDQEVASMPRQPLASATTRRTLSQPGNFSDRDRGISKIVGNPTASVHYPTHGTIMTSMRRGAANLFGGVWCRNLGPQSVMHNYA